MGSSASYLAVEPSDVTEELCVRESLMLLFKRCRNAVFNWCPCISVFCALFENSQKTIGQHLTNLVGRVYLFVDSQMPNDLFVSEAIFPKFR